MTHLTAQVMANVVTILCDNTISQSGVVGEHGFSVLIEKGEEKYLFDTGPGMSLPLNLKTLNKNFNGLKQVFISHGHYDHTGGLKWVLQQVGKIRVTAHPKVFREHMIHDSGRPEPSSTRYIGVPFSRTELESLGADFLFLDRTTEAAPGVWFVTGIDRKPEFSPRDARLLIREGDRLSPDPIEDDASLLLETDTDPVLILGCAHSGVLNILGHLREEMGISRLKAVLGGTHLMFYAPEHLPRVVKEFENFSIQLIAVSHCSGFKAAVELSNHFGERFALASAGSAFEF